MAGEKSGSLAEVLDRYISYQKLALAVRKKMMVSLMYPCVLIVLVILLMVFLVTYVVPNFATLYTSMQAKLPAMTVMPDRRRHHRAEIHPGLRRRRWSAAIFLFRWWAQRDSARETDRPGQAANCRLLGEIWLKYQVAQFSRVF